LDGKIETTLDIRREGQMIHIQREGSATAWNVLLVGLDSVERVKEAILEIVDESALIKVDPQTDELAIQLK
jgi:hypothetical protein